ncbi:MAG TPA: M20/M25/M40 family metallo-hydrolase [Thermoanaerobaculia bacterium]|nr:M20/M25/M40 family metallo-hydrolase [Thermoanaerobaculia bacterium]
MRLAPVLLLLLPWLGSFSATARADDPPPSFADELVALLSTPRVVGREGAAAGLVAQRLGDLPVERDRLGSLVLLVGAGPPRRLLAAPLDEPGYAVSRIQEDGYLRLVPLGDGRRGALWDQHHFGQQVTITTARGAVSGAIAIPSTHLVRLRGDSDDPLTFHDAFVDVGAESASEVAALGVELMDPVTLVKRPVRLADGTVAAPSAALGAGAMALVEAARRAARDGVEGTAVFAWTVLDSLNRKGLEAVVNRHGPFDEALLLSNPDRFGVSGASGGDGAPPQPGSGPLVSGARATAETARPHDERRPSPGTRGPHWGEARLTWLGLPARFLATPVETVSLADAWFLAEILASLGGKPGNAPVRRPELPQRGPRPSAPLHRAEAELLAALIARPGVSGAEGPVREEIHARLPAWARPEVDGAGNLTVSLGPPATAANRGAHRVFVAHLDEVGFRVDRVGDDGRLELSERGGFYPWLWEAQAAVVRTATGDLPAIFEPREGHLTSDTREPPAPLVADLGAGSRARALELGVVEGETTATMPKEMVRLGRHRAVARGFDDRVGSAALLLALARLDPATITRPLTFAWSTEEEVGLIGAAALAERLGEIETVFPVDTHVSSDSPLEGDGYAWSALGKGAVLRTLESILFVAREDLDAVRALASERGIPLQVAMTHGGTDGQPFLAYGGRSVPLSWPGRYSHSPVEVMDLRDLDTLVELVVALAEEPPGG